MKKTICFSFSIFALVVSAVPLRFEAPADSTKTYQASAYHGETLEIEAQLTWRNAPLAIQGESVATMLWQTNGMGDVWWTAPASVSRAGLVSATWNPTNDVGADLYRVFLLVSGDGGTSYRANLMLRLLGSPGATPNALPLPAPFIDFSQVVVSNAPWGEGGGTDGQAVTNIVEGIVADATNALPRGVAIDLRGDGSTIATNAALSGTAYTEWDNYGELPDGQPTYGLSLVFDEIAQHEAFADRYPAKTSLGTAAYRDATEFATSTDEALVTQLIMGSNVVAEVTNYNSVVRSPQLRLLQLDEGTKVYVTVWAETNGLTRTFNEAKAYTDATSNALDMVKADRAWSKHTSGLGADAPDGVTWISTPQTVISGGYEYERHITTHGEVWVLTSNGMGFGGDTNSYFRVSTPDGETLFSIEKTDEQIVGVQTDGISVSAGTVTLNVGVVTYNGQAPICMAAQSVNGPWADLSEGRPAWISSVVTNGVNGAWSFDLESTASAAFFYFMVKQPGATVIKNSAQTDFSGGILVEGTRFYPHKSGSTLTWTTTP